WLASGTGLAAVLSMFAVAVNSRALTLADFGMFVLFQSSALLLAGVFTFATQQPVIKLGVQALQAGERERFEQLVGMGLVADLISAAATTVVAVGAVLMLPNLIGLPEDRVVPALIVAAS